MQYILFNNHKAFIPLHTEKSMTSLAEKLRDKDLESALSLIIDAENNQYMLYRGAPSNDKNVVSNPFIVGKYSIVDELFKDLERENEYFVNYAVITFGLTDNLNEEQIKEINEANSKKKKPYNFVEVRILKS